MKNISLLLGMMAVALTSCSDSFLDKLPDERTEIDTEEKVISLLVTSYPSANYGWPCELTSDNIMDLNSVHLPASPQAAQNPTHYNLTSYGRQDDELFRFEPVKSSTSSDTPANIWEGFYDAICSTNEALQAIDELAPDRDKMSEKLRAARAEALLIRAYCHFVLVNVFSQAYKDETASKNDIGIPYLYEPETDVQAKYDRSNVADTYAKIQADLEEGLKDISDVNYQLPKWRFNTTAAHAFAARFYLYTRQWAKVVEHADAALGTDNATLLPKMFDYSPLDDCSYSNDFANVWQSPYIYSNFMLMDTYSIISRHARYRYEQGSLCARAIYYHNAPMWSRWIANPTVFVSGLFGGRDYGWFPGWIGEQFQYIDKVAGIGYAHTVRREFTATETLLMRAEAKIMLGDYAGGTDDLITYHKSIMKFSDTNYNIYAANNGMTPLTEEMIQEWFADSGNFNCFDSWDFTQRMSSSYVIPAEAVPYMNCVNYWRRYELNYTGLRLFDLKRWGMEWSHEYGPNNIVYTMTWDDPRRAMEVPQEAIAVGLEPSRPQINDTYADDKSVSFSDFFGTNE